MITDNEENGSKIVGDLAVRLRVCAHTERYYLEYIGTDILYTFKKVLLKFSRKLSRKIRGR